MPQSQIRYRDQVLAFPAVDDIDSMKIDKTTDVRQNFSTSGLAESVLINPHEIVEIGSMDIINEVTTEGLEAFWSHVRRGGPFSFAEDNTDEVLTALEADVPAGSTRLPLSSLRGIVPGTKYLLMDDLIGRNDGVNVLAGAPAICDSTTAFTLDGMTAQLITPQRAMAGTLSVRFHLRIIRGVFFGSVSTTGPAIPKDSVATFSIWYQATTPNAWALWLGGLVGGVWVWTRSPIIGPPPVAANHWRREYVTAYFPEGATQTQVKVGNVVTPGDFWMQTDAWQLELHKKHPTPWFTGGGDREATESAEGLTEVVTVRAIRGFPVAEMNFMNTWVTLEAPTKFAHKRRDALRSQRYWERVVTVDTSSPLGLKNFTSDFSHKFREIP